MISIKSLLACPAVICGGIAAASVFSLGFALTSQYAFGLQPCELCIYQRWPYVITALLGAVGLYFARKAPKKSAAIAAISSVIFLTGAVIAFYHAGVEQHWWRSFLEGCQVSFGDMSTEEMLEQIRNAKAARCDEIPWQMFGISMAGYNALLSLALSAGSLLGAVFITRKTSNCN